ncbi:uncharacterized protein [Henckelia pumila]|uniref:uncharacterized protein n=1 Tax=Henckelia pumila TaxID=405737 RepID=UPI003C6DDD8C
MATNARSVSYSFQEDIHICDVYLDISQDLIIGINQSRNQFCDRVEQSYNNSRAPDITEVRNKRSVQSRMGLILSAISKLRACIQQVELLHPSGASKMDIIIRAKELMKQDANFKKGFKFDHVWTIMKDMEKFTASHIPSSTPIQRGIEFFESPQSDTQATDSPKSASLGLSPFEINLSDENSGGSSSQRPLGVKISKLKKKKDEYMSQTIESMKLGQEKILEIIQHGNAYREQNNELQLKRMLQTERKLEQNETKIEQNRQMLDLTGFQEENKILLIDLNSIQDRSLRENFRAEQSRILNEREERKRARDSLNYGKYFGDIGGSGSSLPPF